MPQGLFGLVAVKSSHICNQWEYSAPEHDNRLSEIPGESWCQLHMPLNGSIRILDLGEFNVVSIATAALEHAIVDMS